VVDAVDFTAQRRAVAEQLFELLSHPVVQRRRIPILLVGPYITQININVVSFHPMLSLAPAKIHISVVPFYPISAPISPVRVAVQPSGAAPPHSHPAGRALYHPNPRHCGAIPPNAMAWSRPNTRQCGAILPNISPKSPVRGAVTTLWCSAAASPSCW